MREDSRMRSAILCGKIGVEDAGALERCLLDSGLFEVSELTVDEQPTRFWSLVRQRDRLLALMAALTYCAEFADWADIFCCCYSSTDTFDGGPARPSARADG